ncbi:MAG: Uma2 family endonuclease [Haliscomenobacter sp.]|uniref:Uma2 family endonuclease n=1 Tax=Haliscomenobacter sp. TaxID=2717303 RepID=UPI0029A69755|nr:Uma2 family endonuclease [Haliscomenobacter sp.]MDX2070071.1 Uma2 family endonuclease [Haliscomenobacter sp.]
MSALAEAKKTWTIEEYLAQEQREGERYEYRDGNIILMVGGSINHNRIAQNLSKYLDNALEDKPKFQVFGSDQKIYLPKFNFYVYADALVVAETSLIAKEEAQAITNPILVVEILSKTTEQYDRKQKFLEYRSLPSFKEYVLVRQDKPEVLTFYKVKSNLWQEEEFVGLEGVVSLKSLGIELRLGDIYRRVEF